MKTPEGYEKDDIDKWLKTVPDHIIWHFKPYMAGFGKSGVPDYCLCLLGEFWTAEVKRPGKEPTPIQHRRMKEVRKAGGYAVAGTADVIIAELRMALIRHGIVEY